jgi:hypothetical protein
MCGAGREDGGEWEGGGGRGVEVVVGGEVGGEGF